MARPYTCNRPKVLRHLLVLETSGLSAGAFFSFPLERPEHGPGHGEAAQENHCAQHNHDLNRDFALRKLSSQATSDIYELLIERHTRSSTIVTSNRSVEEWMTVFDEPMLGQSALDRFCHRAHQFVIDGESYRKRMATSSAAPLKTGRKATV